METFYQDLRYALRIFAHNKSFTLIAILALSIGIGSNIAVFTVGNALLLRPLPYPESERLVQMLSVICFIVNVRQQISTD